MDQHPAVVRVDGLTARDGSTLAVDGLTFAVRPGHVTGFLAAAACCQRTVKTPFMPAVAWPGTVQR
jgi:hypothetical protein